MGKKLRTREVLTDTDHENEEDNLALPINGTMSSGAIRQRLNNHRTQRSQHAKTKLTSINHIIQTFAADTAIEPLETF